MLSAVNMLRLILKTSKWTVKIWIHILAYIITLISAECYILKKKKKKENTMKKKKKKKKKQTKKNNKMFKLYIK